MKLSGKRNRELATEEDRSDSEAREIVDLHVKSYRWSFISKTIVQQRSVCCGQNDLSFLF